MMQVWDGGASGRSQEAGVPGEWSWTTAHVLLIYAMQMMSRGGSSDFFNFLRSSWKEGCDFLQCAWCGGIFRLCSRLLVRLLGFGQHFTVLFFLGYVCSAYSQGWKHTHVIPNCLIVPVVTRARARIAGINGNTTSRGSFRLQRRYF